MKYILIAVSSALLLTGCNTETQKTVKEVQVQEDIYDRIPSGVPCEVFEFDEQYDCEAVARSWQVGFEQAILMVHATDPESDFVKAFLDENGELKGEKTEYGYVTVFARCVEEGKIQQFGESLALYMEARANGVDAECNRTVEYDKAFSGVEPRTSWK